MVRLSRTTRGPDFENGNQRSLLGELGVPTTPARRAITVSREEHARPALRAVRPLSRDSIAVNLVELPLEAGGPFLLLRLGHHFASFFLPSGFFSAFFSSFFSSFFSAGFLSSLAAGFFLSLGAPFSGFSSGFASPFRASAFRRAPRFSAFSAPGAGAGFSRFRAASFSLTSRLVNFLRAGM